jgi:hypothetical protein
VVALLAVLGVGVLFAVAFWWALPHDENPWPYTWNPRSWSGPWRWGWFPWPPEQDVARRLRAAMRQAQQEEGSREQPLPDEPPRRHRDWVDDLPSAADIARFGGEPDDPEQPD